MFLALSPTAAWATGDYSGFALFPLLLIVVPATIGVLMGVIAKHKRMPAFRGVGWFLGFAFLALAATVLLAEVLAGNSNRGLNHFLGRFGEFTLVFLFALPAYFLAYPLGFRIGNPPESSEASAGNNKDDAK